MTVVEEIAGKNLGASMRESNVQGTSILSSSSIGQNSTVSYPKKFLSQGNVGRAKTLRSVFGTERLKRSNSRHLSAFFSHYLQLGYLGHDGLRQS